MLNKILIAIDGSKESMTAAKIANRYIEHGLVEELIVLNVEPVFVVKNVDSGIAIGDGEDWNKIACEYGNSVIEEACQNIKTLVTITKKVVMGDAAEQICKCANTNDCDMVIMGNRGNGPLKGLLLGSVCIKVLKYVKCPVLIVKAYEKDFIERSEKDV